MDSDSLICLTTERAEGKEEGCSSLVCLWVGWIVSVTSGNGSLGVELFIASFVLLSGEVCME